MLGPHARPIIYTELTMKGRAVAVDDLTAAAGRFGHSLRYVTDDMLAEMTFILAGIAVRGRMILEWKS